MPLVIAMVLGPVFEINLHLTVQLEQLGRIDLFPRPAVIVLRLLVVLALVWPMISTGRKAAGDRHR